MTNSVVPKMAAGAFFGQHGHRTTTPSFEFVELQATVPERQVPRHTHETPHFILITKGVYQTEARNQKDFCLSGTLIFNPAGTTHRDCFRSEKGMFVGISPSARISKLLDRAPSVSLVVADGRAARLANGAQISDRIARELRRRTGPCSMTLEGLGLELTGLVAELEDRTASHTAPNWLRRAKEMIEDCAEWNLTIAQLAESAGVHPVYLARAYRRYFRCSPGEHLRRCRVLRVQRLLSDTDVPLVEIALRCGFSDQSQMTRLFSSNFGISPARYRSLL